MRVAIRQEPNGSNYIDKDLRDSIDYTKPPYNFTIKTVDDQYGDCEGADFNDDLEFSVEKYNARKQNEELQSLRNQREIECFPIINRGKLWYDTLTPKGIQELDEWYHAWLDVTDTKVIPEKPEWLN